ncbi:Aste57867_13798 [Aphanomyces stellatus]|uniref:Aste57867_13798 protein n=1 Tax=Aphanomyces stellatus TaxID=120398 RepID=A0A485KZ07_9STRA|nr:hypothetical protein As57867_013748 [Aphanomyces stellatus]VFT90630.1 Aste57867_13798 [Aphanomyces stellatus]
MRLLQHWNGQFGTMDAVIEGEEGAPPPPSVEEEECYFRMEMKAWSCEVRQVLSRVIALGTVAVPPPVEAVSPAPICETGGSPITTEQSVFTLLRDNKCQLLWTLKGSNGFILQTNGRHDVVLFPQAMAKWDAGVYYAHALDALTFVRMDPAPPKLQSQPATTLQELDEIHARAVALKQARDALLTRFQAVCGAAAYAAFRAAAASKYHKQALSFIYDYMKTIAKARVRSRERLRTRQTQFQVWFSHMAPPDVTPSAPPLAVVAPPASEVVDLSAQASPRAAAVTDLTAVTAGLSMTTTDAQALPPPLERGPDKPRIIHWHVEKIAHACRQTNAGMVDAQAIAETIKEAIDYLMPMDSFSANQMNQTILAIERDLSRRDAAYIRVRVTPLALSPFLRSFFPPPVKKAPKLPALNRRGCRVHFSHMIHQIKYFSSEDAPKAVQAAEVHRNNDNIKEGASMERRPKLLSYDARPIKYLRLS